MNAFTVKVPATTANIGPGFDCIGLALELWNEAFFSFDHKGLDISIEGFSNLIEEDPTNNLIYRSFEMFCINRQVKMPADLSIHCTNRIPMGSGMGSSSSAIILGLYAADAWLEAHTSKDNFLEMAALVEGHPDNVAPAIYGGLVAAMIDEQEVCSRQYKTADWNTAVILPNMVLLTENSRKALPKQVTLKDAVYNISHSMMVLDALENGDENLLRRAMKDRLHQQYRLPLIPGAECACQAAMDCGAAAVGLSGAGPGLIAFSMGDTTAIIDGMRKAFLEAGLESDAYALKISRKGAFVEAQI